MNNLVKNTIQKQLLGFDDIEFNHSSSTSINQNVSNDIKDWRFIQENFVDLGLPSGTLWCKYNLGATCGSAPGSWYGHYYMWGSVKPNDNINGWWKYVPFNNGKNKFDKDYFNKHMYEFIDHNGSLLPEYDAAYQTNTLMHMPTLSQLQELDVETIHKWVENYNDIEELNGMLITSKINENTLFIPAAGCRYQSDIGRSSVCSLWSRSLNFAAPSRAYIIWIRSDEFDGFSGHNNRVIGQPIRGVI